MKGISRRIVLATMLLAATGAWADANLLSVTQTIRIDASPERVWRYVGDFGGLARWFTLIEGSRLVLKQGNEVGAIRELVRRNGTRVTEKLVEYDPWNMRLSYTYADGMVLASDYFSTMEVRPVGTDQAEVVWTGSLRRLNYWEDPPPPGQDDATLTQLYERIYSTGLAALKKTVEGGE
jgi:mxaD protein